MKRRTVFLLCLFAELMCFTTGCARAATQAAFGDEWVDKATGHRVIRLSRREGANETVYFHQNPFTADGDKMVFLGSTEKGRCAFTVDLKTLAVQQITDRPVAFEVVAPKSRELFYLSGDVVCATHVDTGVTREIVKVPPPYAHGRGFSVNADETLLLGCYAKGEEEFYKKMPRDQWIRKIFEAKLPNALYTIEIATGEINEFYHENEWLGHAQFSPTDRSLVEFCHEGPERELHRMWLVRCDGAGLRKLYPSDVPRTLVTHEFWEPGGGRIWFDLQVPRLGGHLHFLTYLFGPHTYLACCDIDKDSTVLYPLHRSQYSWHYNIARDGTVLCGDGEGRYFELTRSARWINLYRPDGKKMSVQRLVNLSKHSYAIAPNTHFTPDGNWVIFQADFSGRLQVYAVELAAAGKPHS